MLSHSVTSVSNTFVVHWGIEVCWFILWRIYGTHNEGTLVSLLQYSLYCSGSFWPLWVHQFFILSDLNVLLTLCPLKNCHSSQYHEIVIPVLKNMIFDLKKEILLSINSSQWFAGKSKKGQKWPSGHFSENGQKIYFWIHSIKETWWKFQSSTRARRWNGEIKTVLHAWYSKRTNNQQIIDVVKGTDMSRFNLKACFEIFYAA